MGNNNILENIYKELGFSLDGDNYEVSLILNDIGINYKNLGHYAKSK